MAKTFVNVKILTNISIATYKDAFMIVVGLQIQ